MTAGRRRRVGIGALALLLVAAIAPVSAHASGRARPAWPPRVVRDVRLQRLFDSYGDHGDGSRWTGSDSFMSLRLPDGRTIWTGGDTFLGTVNRDHSRDPQGFIHNCYVVQQRKGALGPTLFTEGASPGALFQPPAPGSWYWPSAPFVEGGRLRQFLLRISGAGPVFSIVGTEIATLGLPALHVLSIDPVPASGAYLPTAGPGAPVYYGLAVDQERDWTYVYGLETLGFDKYLHVARAPAGHVMDAPWTFWTGSDWSLLPAQSARVMTGAGDEMSVVRTRHGYRAIASHDSLSPEIDLWTAPHPWGPWSTPRVAYHAPESTADTVTYNAKEHVEQDGRDYVSVSYDVNASSSNSNGLYADVENYRPRFLRVYLPPDLP